MENKPASALEHRLQIVWAALQGATIGGVAYAGFKFLLGS